MTDIYRFISDLKELSMALQHLPKYVGVKAAEMFDDNFDKQSFFGDKWTPSKYVARENKRAGKRRNLLQKTGHLRKSIQYRTGADFVTFFSSLPYAEIHNEGGIAPHPGGTAYFKKGNKAIWVSNRTAERYAGIRKRELPRTKPHDIPIPKRQFIGDHAKLETEIEKIVERQILKALK